MFIQTPLNTETISIVTMLWYMQQGFKCILGLSNTRSNAIYMYIRNITHMQHEKKHYLSNNNLVKMMNARINDVDH